MSVKNTGSFNAIGDDGLEYTVYICQEQIIVENMNGREILNGMKSFQLNNGDKLNKQSDGTYRVVRTGVIVTPI